MKTRTFELTILYLLYGLSFFMGGYYSCMVSHYNQNAPSIDEKRIQHYDK